MVVNPTEIVSPTSGNIIYTLRPENYQCLFHTEGQLQKIPLERCCFEIQAQLRCEHHSAELWKCFTAIDSPHFYLINDQTYRYCQIEGYELG